MAQFNFKAIGTTWTIDIFQDFSVAEEANVLARIMARIDMFDKAYSRFRSDSIVAEVAQKAGVYSLPSDSEKMFDLYHDLYLRTGGFFTPLVGKLLVDAGYDSEYSLKQKGELEIPPAWDEVMEFKKNDEETNSPMLVIKKPVQLDFGAAGKGYLIDLVGETLESHGITEYCINAGGDILHKRITGKEKNDPIRVGLEDPENTEQVIGVYELKNKSICGSAGNRRAWGNFTHIMNPKTLASPTEIIALWVVADHAILADALTTCLFFVKPETLGDAYKFEYLIMYKDRSIEKSDGFVAELFTK
jgi:thiamine biosynthesis lipoprotein